MNKFLLSALLASTVMFSGSVKAAEKETAVPTADKQIEMVKHHECFDKDFHEKMAKKMAQDLGLTQEQQEQAKKIREEGVKKMKPLMKEMKEIRQKMDKERRANMEEFEKILTPEQKDKFEKLKENSPFGKKGRGGFRKHHKGRPNHKMMKGMHEKPTSEK